MLYPREMWKVHLDPRLSECNQLLDAQQPEDNDKPLTVTPPFLSLICYFSKRLTACGLIAAISLHRVPYLIINTRSSTVMDLSNQFLPFYSRCHHHISALHCHNLLCHNTGFTLINPENAIRLIFIKCNSGHVTYLLKNFQQFLNALRTKSICLSLEFSVPVLTVSLGSLFSSLVIDSYFYP